MITRVIKKLVVPINVFPLIIKNLKLTEYNYRSNYLGQMESIVYPDGEKVSYGYDYGGNVTSVTGKNNATDFTYVKNIGYDEWGQRVYLKLGNDSETRYTYDGKRRWLSHIETKHGSTLLQNIKYSFDPVGNVLGYQNTAGGYTTKQDYTYDSLYQLTSVEGESKNYQYGIHEYTAYYNQQYQFDSQGLGNMTLKSSSTASTPPRLLGDPLDYQLNYEYEPGFAHRASRIGNQYYRYDLNGSVTEVRDGPFEAAPERTNPVVYDLGDKTYYAEGGWALNDPKPGTGTTAGKTQKEYRWDDRNRLAYSDDGRYNVRYTYGEDGERTGKWAMSNKGGESESLYFGKLWSWHYDGAVDDFNGMNSKHIFVGETRIATKVVYADGSFITDAEKQRQYYYHSDHLGSAQLVTDYKGDEYERFEYTPYGEVWIEKAAAASALDVPYRFTGKERDKETGLYYYGARYLDPRESRWLSVDPAMGDYVPSPGQEAGKLPGMGGVFNTVNLHVYHYAGNNPVKYVDPDGNASILTRPINRDVDRTYDAANWIGKKTGIGATLHSLVDMGDLTSVSNVYQYSGKGSGFTYSDTYSKEKTYKVLYSGMDDALTEKAAKNVLKQERFGAGDNEKAKELYKIFSNDCNDFTKAVFNEYEKLWKEDFLSKNDGASERDVNKAWDNHKKEISQDRGKQVEIKE
jgi:RHS repeat-associated protein